MKKIPGILLLTILSVALIGCASTRTYRVQVNGYTEEAAVAPFAVGVSFFVVEDQDAANPLLEKEVKAKLDKLLEKKGYILAPYEQAEYCLLFTYGMGTPQTVSVAEPSWGIGVGFGTGYWGPGAGYGFFWPGWGAYPYYSEIETFYDRWLRLTVVDGKQYRISGKKAPVVSTK